MKMSSKLRREDGAAAVEFAIIVSLLVMLVFGMMQYGLAFFQTQNLRASVREGARVAAVRGTPTEISQAISSASAGTLPSDFSGWTQSTTCTDATVGTEVTVNIDPSALPAPVQEEFVINIPFGPAIDLRPHLDISGSFRCE